MPLAEPGGCTPGFAQLVVDQPVTSHHGTTTQWGLDHASGPRATFKLPG